MNFFQFFWSFSPCLARTATKVTDKIGYYESALLGKEQQRKFTKAILRRQIRELQLKYAKKPV